MATEAQAPLTVLYDATCPLCRRLADYGRVRARDALHFVPWQDFVETAGAAAYFTREEREADPTQLRVIREGDILSDREAWEAILAAYPPFETLSWIASRLGLLGTVSKITYYGGKWARRACGTCP